MSLHTPAATSENKIGRIHGLDSYRGILMMLGVVLHVICTYIPGMSWILDPLTSQPLLGAVVDWIHMFRMPAFFALSGFFAALRRCQAVL